MSGNSNSGRRNRAREAKQRSLGDMCTSYIQDNWDKFTEPQRMKIALTIAQRTVADRSESVSKVELTQLEAEKSYAEARRILKELEIAN